MPETITILSTTIQQPGAWNLHLPYADPAEPDWITATTDGYRLNPDFQVASIELRYRWIGIGDTVSEYQQVARREDGYWNGDKEISADDVQALVQAVAHLHPQPQILNANTHTDDYPYWTIELTGLDGEHVLLYSESNAPNFSPWNVIYKGKIYAQFDGQIATAVPALFIIAEGSPLAYFEWERGEAGYLQVTSDTSQLEQLYTGFSGLLPLSRNFTYWPDPQKGELRGRMEAFTPSEGTVAQGIGPLTDLQKIEIDVAEGQTVACSLTKGSANPKEPTNPEYFIWTFACPVGEPGESGSYRYPIRTVFNTGVNQTYTLSGELSGYWQPGTVVSAAPYPEEIGKILEADPAVKDLLSDHRLVVIKSISLADPATGLLDHSWDADVTLLGQVQTGERVVPYSVTIEAEVKDSKLVHWDLDRSELQSLLRDALNQAITRRFLDGVPDLAFNLYYGKVSDNPMVEEDELQACDGIPVASPLPNEGHPLRAFAFSRLFPNNQQFTYDQNWDLYNMQVLLLDGGLRLNYLSLNRSSPEDAFWMSLMPPELQPQGLPQFREISKMPFGLSMAIYWDENASLVEDNLYYAIFNRLNVEIEKKVHGIWLLQVMFDFTPDGRLKLVSCQVP